MDFSRHPPAMVSLVEKMLDLHRWLAETKTGHEKTLLSRQIDGDRPADRPARLRASRID
ncbi:MAG TPA: hypothetical protein PLY09_01230 [Methanothrix sp.]|nr:hypothetical protein [Methanothrix sp.]HPJ83367.1 hypothetical protein [Methanothrix sp.]